MYNSFDNIKLYKLCIKYNISAPLEIFLTRERKENRCELIQLYISAVNQPDWKTLVLIDCASTALVINKSVHNHKLKVIILITVIKITTTISSCTYSSYRTNFLASSSIFKYSNIHL